MIKLPAKMKCPRCDGDGYVIVTNAVMSMKNPHNHRVKCPRDGCEDGYIWNLGDLYRAVEDAGAIPDSKLKPKEGAPDYIAVIITCDSEHEDRGDSHEEAMVNVINKVNEEAEGDGKR